MSGTEFRLIIFAAFTMFINFSYDQRAAMPGERLVAMLYLARSLLYY